jgi:hypothetical protein
MIVMGYPTIVELAFNHLQVFLESLVLVATRMAIFINHLPLVLCQTWQLHGKRVIELVCLTENFFLGSYNRANRH